MTPIRLLELRNTYKWGGGPDKTVLLSAEQHDRTLVDVVVVYVRSPHDAAFCLAEKARERGITCYEVLEHGRLDVRVVSALRDIVRRHQINVIHGHDYKSDLFATLLRWWMGRRDFALVSTMHGWDVHGLRGALYWRFDLALMRRFDQLIAVSQATKDGMVRAGVPPQRIQVIHNAIDTAVWAPHRVGTSLREALGLQQAFPVLGYVGRLTPEKDLVTWLRAAALVAAHFPTVQCVLVGEGKDGSTMTQLLQLAAALGLAGRVHFPGYQAELLPVYATFDLFVMTSRHEGLSNSLLEAMAMGLPVVTTDVGGTRELVQDGHTGYLRPAGDVEGIAKAILALVHNAQLRQHMGWAARERIEEAFAFASRLRRMEALYARVLGLPCDTAMLRDTALPVHGMEP